METLTLEGAQEPQANAASTRLASLSVMGPANADECYERITLYRWLTAPGPYGPTREMPQPKWPVCNLDEILVSGLFSPPFLHPAMLGEGLSFRSC